MNWGAIQESYFFMFLFLSICLLGGFVLGILLGYVWIQLRLLGRVVLNQLNNASSKKHAQVSTHPRRKRAILFERRVAGARQRMPRESFCLHSV